MNHIIISALGLLLFATSAAHTQDSAQASSFYEGKTVKLVVGGKPGGGYDQYAREIGEALGERISATVVIDNRPGGSGMTAINQVASDKSDGLTLMLMNGIGAALGQLTEAPSIRFKIEDIPVLARVTTEPWVLLVGKDADYTSLQDLIDASRSGETLTFAGLGRVDGPTDTTAVMCEALQLNCRFVVGFTGSSELALSAVRGDVTGLAISDRSARSLSSDGSLVPIAVIGRERSDLLPDVETIFEAADLSEEQAFWIDFRSKVNDIGRAIITSEDTPQERIEFLRSALGEILTDEQFAAEAESKGLPIRYASGREVQDTIDSLFASLPEDRMDDVRDVLLNKYF